MSATQTAPAAKYRAPVYTNAISFACRCSVCGADLRHGDFAKIYPHEMQEPLPSHVIRKDTGEPNMIRYMTRVIGVTRHDDKGKPIECHPDTRAKSAPIMPSAVMPPPAIQPSAVTPAEPQQDMRSMVQSLVMDALKAVVPQNTPPADPFLASVGYPTTPEAMATGVQRVPWPGGPVDGRNGITKQFLGQYPSVTLQELKEQAPSGWITL